jgi:hypothetical protein
VPPAHALSIPIGSQREIASTSASCDIKDDGQWIPSPCVFTLVSVLPKQEIVSLFCLLFISSIRSQVIWHLIGWQDYSNLFSLSYEMHSWSMVFHAAKYQAPVKHPQGRSMGRPELPTSSTSRLPQRLEHDTVIATMMTTMTSGRVADVLEHPTQLQLVEATCYVITRTPMTSSTSS